MDELVCLPVSVLMPLLLGLSLVIWFLSLIVIRMVRDAFAVMLTKDTDDLSKDIW